MLYQFIQILRYTERTSDILQRNATSLTRCSINRTNFQYIPSLRHKFKYRSLKSLFDEQFLNAETTNGERMYFYFHQTSYVPSKMEREKAN